jgi:hypothetical protein
LNAAFQAAYYPGYQCYIQIRRKANPFRGAYHPYTISRHAIVGAGDIINQFRNADFTGNKISQSVKRFVTNIAALCVKAAQTADLFWRYVQHFRIDNTGVPIVANY